MKLLGFAMLLFSGLEFPAKAEDPVLVRFTYRASSGLEPVAGVLLKDEPKELRVLNLKTLYEKSYEKKSILHLQNPASEQDLVTATGIAPLAAWLFKSSLPAQLESGRIALVDGAFAYINLGDDQSVRKTDKFNVYRGEEEIVDPETGEVLGKRQHRIGIVEIVEVRQKLSKIRLLGDVEIPLKIGDTVRLTTGGRSVAVLPFGNADGAIARASTRLVGEMTTNLAKNQVSVVERTQLADVLVELALQQAVIFDQNTIQKIGRQTAAFAVVTGTIENDRRASIINVKLIEVETGRVLRGISVRTKKIEADSAVGDVDASSIVPAASGAIAHWPLDGNTENGISKELGAMMRGKPRFVDGKFDQSLDFGGRRNTGYLELTPEDRVEIVRDKDFAISLWIHPIANQRRWPIAGQGIWGTQGWILEILPSGILSFESWDENDLDNGTVRSSSGAITFGDWNHVALSVKRSRSGNQTKLFVNGNEVDSGNVREGDLGTADYYIGRMHQDYFLGRIDEIWVFQSALTSNQVRELATDKY
ncbi:MAG: FlgO family outer membrane protein [Pirellulales bacterium]|nr:FlgO family outer membrane protein [Pirellulales bacterium]